MSAMSFADAVRTCLTVNYATFSGRARRSEYWWFSLLYLGVSVAVVATSSAIRAPLLNILLLPIIVPMLSVSVRRLHDRGKSGWWMFVALIPVIGPIVYLEGMTRDSSPGSNPYGPFPKTMPSALG